MSNIKLSGIKEAVKEYDDWTRGYAEIWLDCETGEVHTSALVGYNSYIISEADDAFTIMCKCRIWDAQKTTVTEVETKCNAVFAALHKERRE
jgi:hypothetical protein